MKDVLVELWDHVVDVRDDDGDGGRGRVRGDLVIDQFRRPDLEVVNTAVVEDTRVLAVEGDVGRDEVADGQLVLAADLQPEVAPVVLLEAQQQGPRLAGVSVPGPDTQDRDTRDAVLRQGRAIRRVYKTRRLILQGIPGILKTSARTSRSMIKRYNSPFHSPARRLLLQCLLSSARCVYWGPLECGVGSLSDPGMVKRKYNAKMSARRTKYYLRDVLFRAALPLIIRDLLRPRFSPRLF
jgi:hypothetical protein